MRFVVGFAAAAAVVGIGAPGLAAPATQNCALPGAVVTPETSGKSAAQTAGMISDRISSIVGGLGGGVSGGPTSTQLAATQCGTVVVTLTAEEARAQQAARPNSVWGSAAHSRLKKSDVGGQYSGSVKNEVAGYDRRLTQNIIAGASVGLEQVNIKTLYNQGHVKGKSLTVAPYIGYVLTDWLFLDATIGYSHIDYNFLRDTGITGKTDAGRWFGATNITATHREDRLSLRSSLGYLRLRESQDRYVESNGSVVQDSAFHFGQARLTFGAGYDFVVDGATLTPNSFARFEYDLPKSRLVSLGNGLVNSNDRSGVTLGLGLDAAFDNGLKLGLTGTTAEARDNTMAYSIMGNIRFSF